MNQDLNILLSSDANYAPHLGATMQSVIESSHADFDSINFYVIELGIGSENMEKLNAVANKYDNASITYIDFTEYAANLNVNMAWHISISAYARLFINDILPDSVNRILYMDCDMIACRSLKDLWTTDLNGNVIGAVQDTVGNHIKTSIGLTPECRYFNAGLLLIDVQKWREMKMTKRCLEFIEAHDGNVVHHDQGVLNGVVNGDWKRLPLSANLMTIHYIFDLDQIQKYYHDNSIFYSEDEVSEAKRNPVILHFTPSFTSRPWIKSCRHPLRDLYWKSLNQTPWCGMKPGKDNSKLAAKLINWRFRTFKI